ncbi:MAG: carbohydrate binding domain-containing protein, partial [Chitinispirillaceae bacterium]|nr:carbohydrate binding domain-containing protein [Chitinispirillaceae bacterium]
MLRLSYLVVTATLTLMAAGGLVSAADLLSNNTFDKTSSPWSVYTASNELASGELLDGKYVMHINGVGENRWDIQFRHQGLTLEEGHTYTVKFTLVATKATQVYAKIGQAGPPYKEYWNNNWTPFSLEANVPLSVEQTFTMTEPTESGIELAFHLGNGVA